MRKSPDGLNAKGAIHILAPRYKPFGCGICDHSLLLASSLAGAGAVVSIHHAAGNGFAPSVQINGGDLVMLQLSVYGFHAKGVPVWLPGYLKDLKARGARIVTYFHELWVQWASVGSSAFWLSPLQYHVCKQVLAISDRAVFNAEWAYDWGKSRLSGASDYITTFSTIGESPKESTPWRQRPDTLAVFGNAQARADAYHAIIQVTQHQPLCFRGFDLLDLGKTSAALNELLAPDGPVRSRFSQTECTGAASPDQVQALLMSSKFGIFAASWGHASKSSVLAAYAAHGVCPVSIHSQPITRRRVRLAPKPDVHFAILQNIDWQTAGQSAIYASVAQAATASYRPRRDLAALVLQEADAAAIQNGLG